MKQYYFILWDLDVIYHNPCNIIIGHLKAITILAISSVVGNFSLENVCMDCRVEIPWKLVENLLSFTNSCMINCYFQLLYRAGPPITSYSFFLLQQVNIVSCFLAFSLN